MINLIPTLVSVAISGVSKLMHGSDPAPAGSQAAPSGSAVEAGRGVTGNPGSHSDFQSLLEWKNSFAPGAPQDSNPKAPPIPLVAGSGGATGQTLHAAKADDKTNTAPATVAAPGTDMAGLIGAATAAGQASAQPGYSMANLPGQPQASAVGTKTETTAASIAPAPRPTASPADPRPIAVAAPPHPVAVAAAPRPVASAAAPSSTAAAGGNTESDIAAAAGNSVAAAPAPAADTAALATLQKTLRESMPAPPQPHTSRDAAATPGQGPILPLLAPARVSGTLAAPAAAVTASIDIPVGTQGWDHALGQRVVWMVSQKNPTAELHVNPPDLGPLSVTVNVTDNTASANFVAAHAATRDAIANAMPQLRNMLADSGIALGQVTVSAESFAQSGSGQPGYTPPGPGAVPDLSASAPGPSALVSPVRTGRALQGLVDTFA